MPPDHVSRLRLRATVKLLLALAAGAFGIVAFSFVFGGSEPNGSPIERIVLGDLAPGQTRTAGYDNRPVIILHRERATIEALAAEGVAGKHPAWLVVHATGTGRGCPVLWEPEQTHFRESCGSLRYDAAGRPLTAGHPPLEQPPHHIEDGVLTLGRE